MILLPRTACATECSGLHVLSGCRLSQKEFAAVAFTYIADGHHRAASAVKVALKRRGEHPGYTGEEEFNYFLSVLFPDDELQIMAYNRVVKDLNGLSRPGIFRQSPGKFEITGKMQRAQGSKETMGGN